MGWVCGLCPVLRQGNYIPGWLWSWIPENDQIPLVSTSWMVRIQVWLTMPCLWNAKDYFFQIYWCVFSIHWAPASAPFFIPLQYSQALAYTARHQTIALTISFWENRSKQLLQFHPDPTAGMMSHALNPSTYTHTHKPMHTQINI